VGVGQTTTEDFGGGRQGGCEEMGKVLLLGATGGIGGHALLQLLDRGVHVTAIVRSESR